jgi:hypothetical protein
VIAIGNVPVDVIAGIGSEPAANALIVQRRIVVTKTGVPITQACSRRGV